MGSEEVMEEDPPCTEPAHQYFLIHLPNSAALPTRHDPEQPSYQIQGLPTIPRAGATEMGASKSTVPHPQNNCKGVKSHTLEVPSPTWLPSHIVLTCA